MTARITLGFTSGGHIRGACRAAIKTALRLDHEVGFIFNGVRMKIRPDDDFFERIAYYYRELRKTVPVDKSEV